MKKYNEYNSDKFTYIPTIQRDYVQGADANAEKRNRFLETILSALAGLPDKYGKPISGKMDFLYGSTPSKDTDDQGRKGFMPIDGQQRLTTLALVGWLLAQKAGDNDYSLPTLKYRTRTSTEQFCSRLLEYKLPEDYSNVKEHILTVPLWMVEQWKSDPSVMAMLDLLNQADALLSRDCYNDKIKLMTENFFNDSPLTFEMLDMEEYKLTEDLYVKMNARGKQLTNFENWKAGFTGMLETEYKDVNYDGRLIAGQSLTIPEYFSYAIEHQWTDLLWPDAFAKWNGLSDVEKANMPYPRINEQFMNIFDFVTRMLFWTQYPDSLDYSSNPTRKEAEELDFSDQFAGAKKEWLNARRMDVYQKHTDKYGKENVVALFEFMDTLCDISKSQSWDSFFDAMLYNGDWQTNSDKINLFDENTDVNLMKGCIEGKTTLLRDVLLWGLISYCQTYATYQPTAALLTYARCLWVAIWERKARLTKNVMSVNPNLRLEQIADLGGTLRILLSDADVYAAMDAASDKIPKVLKVMNTLRKKGFASELHRLVGCDYLKCDFSSLEDSFEELKDEPGTLMRRFVGLYSKESYEKAKVLINHGWRGSKAKDRIYFFGAKNHWDYVFLDEDFKPVLTNYLTSNEQKPSWEEFSFYVAKYKEFFNSHRGEETPKRAFRADEPFWAVSLASYSLVTPVYKACPYAQTVIAVLEDKLKSKLGLKDRHGTEHGFFEFKNEVYNMECVQAGWILNFEGSTKWKSKWAARFTVVNDLWYDNKGEFHFANQNGRVVLMDRPGIDRVQNCIAFLTALYELIA